MVSIRCHVFDSEIGERGVGGVSETESNAHIVVKGGVVDRGNSERGRVVVNVDLSVC